MKDLLELDYNKETSSKEDRIKNLNLEPRGVASLEQWEYLPISAVESLLDSFFDAWSTRSFDAERFGNDLVGSIILELTFEGETRQLTGTGGVLIPTIEIPENVVCTDISKNKHLNDPTNAKAGETGKALSIVKALCIKNAAKGIGKIFGRDLNRELKGYLTNFDSHKIGLDLDIKDLKNEISFILEEIADENIRANVLNQLLDLEEEGKLTAVFLRQKVKELNELKKS